MGLFRTKSTPDERTVFRNDTPPSEPSPAPEKAFRPGRLIRRALRMLRMLVLVFVISTVAMTILYRFVAPPATPLMLLRVWDQFRAGEPLTLKNDWTSLAEMSPWMPAAVITAEDQRFFEHHGFDFNAIEKARAH